jgi:hypothetical protein
MKYIFVVGAPGSKWSSVAKNIYFSPSIDRSDYSEDKVYAHSVGVTHLGTYFDPGMEYGDFFDHIEQYSKEECETEFDRPFNGQGIRIIKSHVLCNSISFLKQHWPDCPVVTVYRTDDACLGWWVRAGEFNIAYPNYKPYYKDFPTMAYHIDKQNAGILEALKSPSRKVGNNVELCNLLGIERPAEEYYQDYKKADITVNVL